MSFKVVKLHLSYLLSRSKAMPKASFTAVHRLILLVAPFACVSGLAAVASPRNATAHACLANVLNGR